MVSLGPWLKYGPRLAIWSIPRGTMFGWPYGLSNQWMATTWLSGWPCLYRNSHQGVNHSLGINLAGHMSCWTGKGQQYDFRLTLNLSEGQIVSWYKLGCPYELLNQWMATVWSPADSKLVRESNYLEVQALAGHMNCKPMNGNSVVFGWLYIVSESYFFGVGNQALSWARFATDKSDKKLI